MSTSAAFDPALDLELNRLIPAPLERVWEAWTRPELLKQWYCPRPWFVSDCTIDLVPGGAFFTRMNGPAGEVFDNVGCVLEVVPHERLVTTDALLPGWRPAPEPFMTAIIRFSREGTGTRVISQARHASTASREKHEAMGFYNGWGAASDQLAGLLAGTFPPK
ncbi:MAG: SRPBCC family protein [Gemmatimonadetes bacterium]|nr:SRPBCC family protein [Gemmatimonadota bacterium]